MSIFNQLGGQAMPQNPMQMMQQLRADPGAFLSRAGLSVPSGMRDPQQIVQHLLNSGQVSNQRFQQIQQMMGGMNRR